MAGALTSVRSQTMKMNADEKELLESIERGEWTPARVARAHERASAATRGGRSVTG
jgi:hypothetical protein